MELSQYVVETLADEELCKCSRSHNGSRILKSAGEVAREPFDAHVLDVLGNVLSMSFNVDQQCFLPLFTAADGKRTFAMEDIEAEELEILEAAFNATKSLWVCAQLAHILWIKTHNYVYEKKAVEFYIELFKQTFDPEEWVDCYRAIKPAFHIAAKLGKVSEAYKDTRKVIKNALFSMDGSDPLYLSIKLHELILKDSTPDELRKLAVIAGKLAAKNISESNTNYQLAEDTYVVQESILNRLRLDAEVVEAKTNLANYLVTQSKILEDKDDNFRAVMLLKKACTLYSKVDKEKTLDLRKHLELLQQKSLHNMQGIPIKFDTQRLHEVLEKAFSGLSIQEAIVELGRIAKVYKFEEVRSQVLAEQGDHFFSTFFGSSFLNSKVQTVQELPPLSIKDPESDPDLLFKHMVRYVARRRELEDAIPLNIAFGYMRNIGSFSEDSLNFLVENNALIPEGRTDIIREGLYLGLSGKLYAAMHILLPQTENIIRNLVGICGDTVTFLKDDGTEEFKTLSQLFGSEKLRECYSEDLIFTLHSVMDIPIGENLRNLTAHGVLEPSVGNGGAALYFLCVLIRLLSLYSSEARAITFKLAEQEN